MEAAIIAKQILEMQKSLVNSTLEAIILWQDQSERFASSIFDKSMTLPQESHKFMGEWSRAFKKGRQDFIAVIDDNFKTMDAFFNESENASS